VTSRAPAELRQPKPLRMLWITFAWGSCFVAIDIGLTDAPVLWFAALRGFITDRTLGIRPDFLTDATTRGSGGVRP